MRKALIISLLALSSLRLLSQQNSISLLWTDNLERADALLEDKLYDAALQVYMESYLSTEIVEDSLTLSQQKLILSIADCYYKLRRLERSAEFYSQAFAAFKDSTEAYHLLQYAESLLFKEDVQDSKTWFNEYYVRSNDPLGRERFNGTVIYNELMASTKPTRIAAMSINTPYSMISPVSNGDALYFAGPDSSFSLINRDYLKGDMEAYRMYISDSLGVRPVKVGGRLRNISSPVFLPDNRVMFTAGNSSDSFLSTYQAEVKSADQWANPKKITALSFENGSVHSISVNPEFNQVILSAWEENGFGGYDLYQADSTEGGWSELQNLGPIVNTSANELSPSIGSGSFYFASNGHAGLGGYDLFESNSKEVFNLAYPINSSQDDFNIFFTSDSDGYLVSNRSGGKGRDDLYQFTQTEKPEIDFNLTLSRKLNGEILDSVNVFFKGLNRAHDVEALTDVTGALSVSLKTRTHYLMTIEKTGFITLTDTIKTLLQPLSQDYLLDENLTFQALVFESADQSALANPTVFVENLATNSSFEVQGNQVGFFQIQQPSFTKVSVLITKEGYGFVSDTLSFDRPEATKTYTLKKVKPAGTLTLKDLLYESDQYILQNDYVPVLDSIANSLTKFQNLRILIESHTDSRGDRDYNLTLSQKRSESVKAYLVEKGVSPNRIGAIGRGEEQLLNGCSDGVSCSDSQHQVNRRTEIKLFNTSG